MLLQKFKYKNRDSTEINFENKRLKRGQDIKPFLIKVLNFRATKKIENYLNNNFL